MTRPKERSVSKRAMSRAVSKSEVTTTEERVIRKVFLNTDYAEGVANVTTVMGRSSTDETAQHSENAAEAVG